MDKPITLYALELGYEFWFQFEGRIYRQHSLDGIEWDEPELTPMPRIPFVEIDTSKLPPWF